MSRCMFAGLLCLYLWNATVGVGNRCHAQACSGLTVTLEITPDSPQTGATYVVEAFVTNAGPDCLIRWAQIDLPCTLPGKPGSLGEIRAQPAAECMVNADCPTGAVCNTAATPNVCNSLSIGNTSAPSSGGHAWIFAAVAPNGPPGCGGCTGGAKLIAQAACRLGGSPGAGEPPYILPGVGNADRPSGKSYIGTFRYEAGICAGGTINIPYEVLNMPCQPTDLSRLVADDNSCINAVFVAGAITIQSGSCCDDANMCLCDGVSQACCTNVAAVGRPAECMAADNWNSGRTCAGPVPCACTSDAQCDDGQFCNGLETCNLATGQCQEGPPPVCGGTTNCRNGVCDPVAGECIVINKTDGTACPGKFPILNPTCDLPDTCMGGICKNNFAPADTACNKDPNPGDPDCNAPDTCDGQGNCNFNRRPDGSPCPGDGNQCTLDTCQGGKCTHIVLPDGTRCLDDGIPGTEDICQGGICTHGQITIECLPNDGRMRNGCGGNDVDLVYENDDGTGDADVNGGGVIDRLIRSVVVKKGGAVIKTIEIWCVDRAFFAVRVVKAGRGDRQWLV